MRLREFYLFNVGTPVIIHMNLPRKWQHIVEILGILLLMMPFMVILLDHSLGWVADAYRVGESSSSPTGLSHRWIIKSVIPLTMILMIIAALSRLIQEVALLLHLIREPEDMTPGRVSMLRHLFQPQLPQQNRQSDEEACK